MLEVAILGFIKERSMHGYELKQRLTVLHGHFKQVSDGALYPAIARLEQQGLLTRQKEQSETGMTRQTLSITEDGVKKLVDFLSHPSEMDISDRNRFFTLLAFLKYLPVQSQVNVLRKRLSFLEGGRSFFTTNDTPVRFAQEKDPFRAGMLHIAKETSRIEKMWLLQLIEDLDNGGERAIVRVSPEPDTLPGKK